MKEFFTITSDHTVKTNNQSTRFGDFAAAHDAAVARLETDTTTKGVFILKSVAHIGLKRAPIKTEPIGSFDEFLRMGGATFIEKPVHCRAEVNQNQTAEETNIGVAVETHDRPLSGRPSIIGLESMSHMADKLCKYLDNIEINSENIGLVRLQLLMPFDCDWNNMVREQTALREKKVSF